MKKFYRIAFFLLLLSFLSTYTPKNINLNSDEERTFFQIKKIKVINNFLVTEDEIKEKLDSIYRMNIFLLKKGDIEQPLKNINFLKKIEVEKKYPDTIIVKIFESEPVAYLFKNNNKFVLDSLSKLIKFEKDMKLKKLPNIIGQNAEKNFLIFLKILEKNDFPVNKVTNYYYFQIGRWDIELMEKKTIKFPHNNVDNAVKKTIELLNRKDFENYNIIDLRIDDKIIVE